MKRNTALSRTILLAVENDETSTGRGFIDLDIPNHSKEEVSEHVRLLFEDGLIEAIDFSSFDGPDWKPVRLTSQGHNFLNSIRDKNLKGQALSKTEESKDSPVEISNTAPQTFISYSWDNDTHKQWVRKLAEGLRKNGVNATLDQWETSPGDQLPAFMERTIRESKFVVIICTPNYKKRSDSRKGGVGYEGDIMTAEAMNEQNPRKFIPVLRSGNWSDAAPSWLSGKSFIDLSDESDDHERSYKELLNALLETPESPPPVESPHGEHIATATRQSNSAEPDSNAGFEDIKITRLIVEKVTKPRNDGTRGSALYAIPFALSKKPHPMWQKLFIENWNHPPSFTNMHRPGIARIKGANVILDGTTVEEVEKYHRDTLQSAVHITNQQFRKWLNVQERINAREKAMREDHRKRVESVSKRIEFD